MKKSILLLIACLAIATLQAQNKKDDKPDKITFIAGWNYSKYVTDQEDQSTDYKSGLILGINKDAKLSPFLWVNGGLIYYQNGAKTEGGDLELDYLTIPAGIKLKLGPIYGMGGVYGAYRLSAKLADEKIDNGNYNRLDFGTYAGVGFKFLIFSINAKYNWGISDVSNGSNDTPNYDINNRFFSIALGVGIP